ncbi:MAG: metallophosphoesterase [Actinobacteria bacterium]|nr:MAG: metallophosphoesterase [Actinomycetota bacterium]
MIKIAAMGDLHCPRGINIITSALEKINKKADFLVLAGDLTRSGTLSQAYCLIDELKKVTIPILAVLGNHEYHHGKQNEIRKLLIENNVIILDGKSATFQIGKRTIGFAGSKGFCGGYDKAQIPNFGEPSLKGLVDELKHETRKIEKSLKQLSTDYRVVVLHYCPTRATLGTENKEIYFFLGSSLLAKPIDKYKPDIVFHGHCHFGKPQGTTPGGVKVINVALPLIKKPYQIITLK